MSEITQISAVQSRKNRTETAQCKLGKTHVDYWANRLEKRTFKNGDGDRVEVPYWQVRIQHLRRVAYFNLKTANSTEAAAKAREIYVFLVANGWEETLAKYKPRPTQKDDGFSIEEFSDLYRETLKEVEYPPLRRTAECQLGVRAGRAILSASRFGIRASYGFVAKFAQRQPSSWLVKLICHLRRTPE